MKNIYNFEIGIVACQECGAPIEVPLAGGVVSCDYCQADNAVSPRKRGKFELVETAVLDEDKRLELLWEQAGDSSTDEPRKLPREALHRYPEEGWEDDALKVWNELRVETEKSMDPEIEEAFSYLTEVIGNKYRKDGEFIRMRAIFETSLDMLKMPSYQQSLLCKLCRYAALSNDIRGAKKWLEMCNPHSVELKNDSVYRVANATIHIMQENWSEVIAILGDERNIPITDFLQGVVAVMRAGALEKMGTLDAATNSLCPALKGGQQSHIRTTIGVFKESNISLCKECYFNAQRKVYTAIEKRKAKTFIKDLTPFFVIGILSVSVFILSLFVSLPPTLVLLTGILGSAFTVVAAILAFIVKLKSYILANQIEAYGNIISNELNGKEVDGEYCNDVTFEASLPQLSSFQTVADIRPSEYTDKKLEAGTNHWIQLNLKHPEKVLKIL